MTSFPLPKTSRISCQAFGVALEVCFHIPPFIKTLAVLFCLVTFPSSSSSLHSQVTKKLLLLGRSHLLLRADRTSADVSGSSWLLTPVWELHARNHLSKAAHTFPETLKKEKKKCSSLFQSIGQDLPKVQSSPHHPAQPRAEFAAGPAVCSQ